MQVLGLVPAMLVLLVVTLLLLPPHAQRVLPAPFQRLVLLHVPPVQPAPTPQLVQDHVPPVRLVAMLRPALVRVQHVLLVLFRHQAPPPAQCALQESLPLLVRKSVPPAPPARTPLPALLLAPCAPQAQCPLPVQLHVRQHAPLVT